MFLEILPSVYLTGATLLAAIIALRFRKATWPKIKFIAHSERHKNIRITDIGIIWSRFADSREGISPALPRFEFLLYLTFKRNY